MPSFSQTSLERLNSCHDDLILIFSTIVADTDCSILCGHRDQAEQTRAYVSGNSKVQWPDSKHNQEPSLGVDVAPWPFDWEDEKAFCFFAGKAVAVANRLFKDGAISHKLRWGGDWDGDGQTNDQTFYDLVHFELVEVD